MRPLLLSLALALCSAAGAVGCAHASPTEQAFSLVRQGKDAEAVRVLRAHLAKDPDDLPARKLLVRVLALGGDMGAARAEIGVMAARLPADDPTPWVELGHAYELVHAFEEALAAYDEASDRAPRSPVGPREAGLRAAHWGEAEDARPRLEEAVRRGAHDATLMHALGLVRVKLGDLDGAERAYREGLGVDPEAVENQLGLATVAVVRGDAAAALSAYDALLAKRPRFGAAELGRAWALAKLGRVAEARRAIDHAAELGASPDSVAKQRAALAGP